MLVGSHIKPFISNNTNSFPCQSIKTMNAHQDKNNYPLGHMARVCTKPHSISQAFMCCGDNATWRLSSILQHPSCCDSPTWKSFPKQVSKHVIWKMNQQLSYEPTTKFSCSPLLVHPLKGKRKSKEHLSIDLSFNSTRLPLGVRPL